MVFTTLVCFLLAAENMPIQDPLIRLTPDTRLILKEWLIKNVNRPYANKAVMLELSRKTGLTVLQTQTWLSNARQKVWFKKEKLIYLENKKK